MQILEDAKGVKMAICGIQKLAQLLQLNYRVMTVVLATGNINSLWLFSH